MEAIQRVHWMVTEIEATVKLIVDAIEESVQAKERDSIAMIGVVTTANVGVATKVVVISMV